MKIKLSLAVAALLGAFAISASSQAAPLAGANLATPAAKVDGKSTEQVHNRRYGHRRHGYRRYGHRSHGYRRYGYRPYYGGYGYGNPYYQPYYGGYGYSYPYRYYRRPGIYFGFGF